MTEKFEIFKCKICGNIVQVLNSGAGNLVCCGENMELQKIQHDETELGEKHTPKFEEKDGKKFVNVIGHPMINEHYIQFIEVYTKDKKELYIKYFEPNTVPECDISFMKENTEATEYCNIHNLWGSK